MKKLWKIKANVVMKKKLGGQSFAGRFFQDVVFDGGESDGLSIASSKFCCGW
jgi:hypothetical protein